MNSVPHIALVADECGWHCARLKEAFAGRGCRVTRVALPDCEFGADGAGVSLPGFGRTLPDGVFVRGVPAGSLESVVFYLDVLHALREVGVRVYNDARMIERSVDKAMTSFLLRRAGIATPAAWSFARAERARAFVARHGGGGGLVLKPVFGSQGKGLQRIGPGRPLPAADGEERVFYLQQFIKSEGDGWSDWRVFVIGGGAVAGMKRVGRDWVSNVANGAECHGVEIASEAARLAEAAVAAIGLFYAGVDLIRDGEGRWWVTELNSIPAWRGLQSVTSVDIAARLADDFLGGGECTGDRADVRADERANEKGVEEGVGGG
ncbi:MAG: alpha-L-glutamate ligase [Gammaproteobacteria bacterium]|nr:alpha-L-glutamate ligase [Gammaproteobacteria bacterium]